MIIVVIVVMVAVVILLLMALFGEDKRSELGYGEDTVMINISITVLFSVIAIASLLPIFALYTVGIGAVLFILLWVIRQARNVIVKIPEAIMYSLPTPTEWILVDGVRHIKKNGYWVEDKHFKETNTVKTLDKHDDRYGKNRYGRRA